MTLTLVQSTGDEQQTSLSELFAQRDYTILYFYPKDNTPGCTIEAQDFSSMVEELDERQIQVVGVSKDAVRSHCNFIEKHWLQFALITDPDFVVHNDERFQALGEKSMYGKKYMGTLRNTYIVTTQWEVVQSRKNVRAKWHAAAVRDRIQENL